MSPLSVVCVPSRRITRFTQILFNVKRRINHIKTNQIIVTNDNINFWNKATNDITWFKQPTVTFLVLNRCLFHNGIQTVFLIYVTML